MVSKHLIHAHSNVVNTTYQLLENSGSELIVIDYDTYESIENVGDKNAYEYDEPSDTYRLKSTLNASEYQALSSAYKVLYSEVNSPKLPLTTDIHYGEIAVNYSAGLETISLKNNDDEIVTFSSDSVFNAKFDEINQTIEDNEYITAVALNRLQSEIDATSDSAIQTVKVNGTPLIPDANKAVDVEIPRPFDAVEDKNDSPVTSNAVYHAIVDNERVISAAINDIEERIDDITVENLIEKTYSELVGLVNNAALEPGKYYRITDYVTTTTQSYTRSAGHAFDIIVLALNENTLSENARAVKHDGDTYFTDNDVNLNAWEIKYCINNDKSRFHWADETNGKGVIYYMKDEYDNECPYDFKNIQFQRWAVSGITSSTLNSAALNSLVNTYVYDDASQPIHYAFKSSNIVTHTVTLVVNSNVYDFYYTFSWINENGDIEDASIVKQKLSNDDGQVNGVYGNSMKACNELHLIDETVETLAFALSNNVLASSYLYDGGIFYGIHSNTFGNDVYSNTFGNWVNDNTFGNNVYYNTFGNWVNDNTFGNDVYSNTFDDRASYNTFGNDVSSNAFGNYVNSNTFGNNVYDNTFGNNVHYNVFGNFFYSNTFGDAVNYNTFGNNVYDNTFGNNVYDNTFGNSLVNCRFTKDCIYNIMVENGNSYITVTSTQTPTNSNPLRNFTISQGVNNGNSESDRKTISHDTLNDNFKTVYAKDSLGNIIGYNPADIQKVIAEALTDLNERLTSLEQSSVTYHL